MDLRDWNFSRNVNIGTTPPSNMMFFSSDECRVLFSRDLSYFLKILLGSEESRNPHSAPSPSLITERS